MNDPITYMTNYLLGMMKRFNFNTNTNIYPPDTEENSLLTAMERIEYLQTRRGYIAVFGKDSSEYASGSNMSLATSWNMTRPNILYDSIGNGGQILKKQVDTAYSGGGYITYTWVDPKNLITKSTERIMYTKAFSNHLVIGLYYDSHQYVPETLPILSTDILQQLISNYMTSNVSRPDRYLRFLNAIDDGRVMMIGTNGNVILGSPSQQQVQEALTIVSRDGGGYIGKSFCTQVPFLPYIVWYVID